MRSYRIDDLTPEDVQAVKARLDALELGAGMEGVYWLPVGTAHLSPLQQEHTDTCGPHVMALEVEEDFLQLELLVRARNTLRCGCMHYAAPELQRHMMDYVDGLLRELRIAV